MKSSQIVKLVAKREISTKLRDKAFLVATGVFLVIIAGIVVFNVLIAKSSSSYTVGLVGSDSAEYKPALTAAAKAQDVDLKIIDYANLAEAKKAVSADDTDAVLNGTTIIAEQDVDNSLRVVIESANQAVVQGKQITESGLDPGAVSKALTVPPLTVQSLDPNGSNSVERGVIALIAVGIVYFMLLTSGQFVAQGVVEEKSSRVVELLMATVKPWQLLTGKVIGLGVLGLMQLVLIIGLGLGVGLGAGLISVPGSAISTVLQVVAWFVLGYTFFACMFAAGASLVSRQEDLGSAIGPMSFIPIAAFLFAFPILNSPNGTLAHIVSLVPGLSPITMPVRSAMVSVPWYEYVIAVVLQIVAIIALIRLAGRIYAGAMLRTGGKIKMKEALAGSKTE